jgi:Fe-S-cluster containining protein
MDAEELNKKKKLAGSEASKFYKKLKKRPPAGLEEEIRKLDREVFSRTDCLACANCCKTISPVFKNRDITRLAEHFKLRPSEFTHRFLLLDEDGDYVLQSVPCPFLGNNNICSIYDIRPFACKSYPHTSTLPLKQSWDLLPKNTAVCPAVYEITDALKKKYDK